MGKAHSISLLKQSDFMKVVIENNETCYLRLIAKIQEEIKTLKKYERPLKVKRKSSDVKAS